MYCIVYVSVHVIVTVDNFHQDIGNCIKEIENTNDKNLYIQKKEKRELCCVYNR